jgi:hypothetical protein
VRHPRVADCGVTAAGWKEQSVKILDTYGAQKNAVCVAADDASH